MADFEVEFYTPAEVAALFHVRRETVARWANAGLLPSIRTPGGHRRYPAAAMNQLLDLGWPNRPHPLRRHP